MNEKLLGTERSVRLELSEVEGLPYRSDLVPVNRLTDCISWRVAQDLIHDRHWSDVRFVGAAEVLLVPEIASIIRYANARGVHTTIETNASLFYRDRADELVNTGLDRVRVLLGALPVDAYPLEQQLPKPLPVDWWHYQLENLAGLAAAIRAENSRMQVDVIYLLDALTLPLLADMVMLLGGVWVTSVRVQRVGEFDVKQAAVPFRAARRAANEYGVRLDLHYQPLHEPQFISIKDVPTVVRARLASVS